MVLTIAPVPSSRVSYQKTKGKKGPKAKQPKHHGSPKKRKWINSSNDGSIFSDEFGILGAVLRASAHHATRMTTGSTSSTTSGGLSFETNCKLSKVFFTVPRKCSECDKFLAFTAFACQFCRYRVHKRCANFEDPENLRDCQNRCSLSKLPTNDKIFQKLIMENEINPIDMDVFLEQCHELLSKSGSRDGLRHSFSSRTLIYSDSSDPDYSWSARSCPSAGPPTRCQSSPAKVTRCHSHSFSESWDSASSVAAPLSDGGYSSPPPAPPLMINRLWNLFARAQAGAFPSEPPSAKTSTASSGWASTLSRAWGDGAPPPNKPSITESDSGYPSDGAYHPSSKSPSPDARPPHDSSLLRPSFQRRASRSPGTPARTPVDDFNDSVISDFLTHGDSEKRRQDWVRFFTGDRGAQSEECHTSGEMLPSPITPVQTRSEVKQRVTRTWPIAGLHLNHDEDPSTSEDLVLSRRREKDSEHDTKSLGLGEWTIAFEDLVLGHCIVDGRDTKIYQGEWHGHVMIHVFKTNCLSRTAEFKQEVHQLAKLRHENIVLFMGVCVEPPNLAVVTGAHSGDSLHQLLHLKSKNISDHAKFKIARQVAQAVGYMHGKGIVLKSLSSRNVYVESKVKVSIVDSGCPRLPGGFSTHPSAGCLARGHLWYWAPELMRTLRLDPPSAWVERVHSFKSDSWAFGTLMYELFERSFPMPGLRPHPTIFLVGRGQLRERALFPQSNKRVKKLVLSCWNPALHKRPSFGEIADDIERLVRLARHATIEDSLSNKHSSSVPDRLDRIAKPNWL